jgi:hypothetical protein
MTLKVEDECPVAKKLGAVGIGEGIVFIHYNDKGEKEFTFKSKGEKHSKTRVKTLKEVDVGRVAMLQDLADTVTPPWRLEQFMTESCDLLNGGEITRDKISVFIRAVVNDIMKEELDVLAEKGVEPKELNKYISVRCRDHFFAEEKKFNGI